MTKIETTQRAFVNEMISSGIFSDENALIYAAIKKLKEEYEQKKALLFAELDKGFADADAGNFDEFSPDLIKNITKRVIARKQNQ